MFTLGRLWVYGTAPNDACAPAAPVQEGEWEVTQKEEDIYPNFVKMAEAFGVPARRVIKVEDLRPAIR